MVSLKKNLFVAVLLIATFAIAGGLTSCSSEDHEPEETINKVRLEQATIIPYSDRTGREFNPQADAAGCYGPVKVKFVAGDHLHAKLTFGNGEISYTNVTLGNDGKWVFSPVPTPADGVKLVRTTFLYDEKDDLYDNEASISTAWDNSIFCDSYTNPFNYPDFLVQRSKANGDITFEDDWSVSIQLMHMNAILMIDRIDNRTGKEISSITAYNFWGAAQPEDDNNQEFYEMTLINGEETAWITTFSSTSGNTLNQLKIRFLDNEEVIIPVEKPQWDKSESYGAEINWPYIYNVSLEIGANPADCRAIVR